ncbi:hypothetical protein Vi05172_g8951 [Venturia inaequalis]|nr:hypothetical protein Vi05172_g8951 [Venturia inaequalis]
MKELKDDVNGALVINIRLSIEGGTRLGSGPGQ